MLPPSDWRCSAPDHNEAEYCSNPECFKAKKPLPMWAEFDREVERYWELIRTKRT